MPSLIPPIDESYEDDLTTMTDEVILCSNNFAMPVRDDDVLDVAEIRRGRTAAADYPYLMMARIRRIGVDD